MKRPNIALGARSELERVRDDIVRVLAGQGGLPMGVREIRFSVQASAAIIGRALAALTAEGSVVSEGAGKRTRYRLPQR